MDVLLNGHLVGTLDPDARRKYSLHIPAASLRKANVLTFRFAEPDDGMSLNDPILKFQNTVIRDPRDTALRRVRTAHWGKDAVDWGGFIVGNAAPPDETPFHRKQNEFCFVLGR